jgi:D-alanyl-lipoteichoic acid acyltransferase DltB (MBOAT superfamily)
MMIAMWHVTSVAFVIWGLWHGLGMCILKLWLEFWGKVETKNTAGLARSLQLWSRGHPRTASLASTVFTFHYVALGWLPFWGGHPQGLSMILRILSGNHWKLFVW